jgi:hypothetical protein
MFHYDLFYSVDLVAMQESHQAIRKTTDLLLLQCSSAQGCAFPD